MRFHVFDLLLIKTGAGTQFILRPSSSTGRVLNGVEQKAMTTQQVPLSLFQSNNKGEKSKRGFPGARVTFAKDL